MANNLQNWAYIRDTLVAGPEFMGIYRRTLAKYTKEFEKMGYFVAPNGGVLVKNVSTQEPPASK